MSYWHSVTGDIFVLKDGYIVTPLAVPITWNLRRQKNWPEEQTNKYEIQPGKKRKS